MSGRILRVAGIGLVLSVVFALGIAVGNQTSPVLAGAAANELQQNHAGQDNADEQGIVIVSVDADGAAAQAGVVRGDILLAVDDETINSLSDLHDALDAREAGDEVTLTVLHGDDQRTLNATLDDRNGRAYLGVSSCGSIGENVLKWTAELEAQRGATILDVQEDSPAQAAGLEAGDRIVAIDDAELNGQSSLADLIAAHQPGDRVTLTVENADQESREVEVTLGEHPDKEGVAYLGVQYGGSFPRVFKFGGDARPFGDVPFFRDHTPFEFRFGDLGNLDKSGVIVGNVSADSPASAAGLQAGDLITAIDGEELTAPNSLLDAISAHQVGDTVVLTVSRAGESDALQIEATLAESPDEAGQAYLGVKIGGFVSTHRFDGGSLPDGFSLPDLEFNLPFDGFRFHIDPDKPEPQELDSSTSL